MKQKFVIQNLGENVHYPPDSECLPVATFLEEYDTYFTGMKNENRVSVRKKDTRCWSFDDNQLVLVDVAWVREIEIGNLTTDEYLSNDFFFERIESLLVTESRERILKLSQVERVAGIEYGLKIAELLSYNGKSGFKSSLKDQVNKWLDEDEHKYALPLSNSQFVALTRDWRKR